MQGTHKSVKDAKQAGGCTKVLHDYPRSSAPLHLSCTHLSCRSIARASNPLLCRKERSHAVTPPTLHHTRRPLSSVGQEGRASSQSQHTATPADARQHNEQ